MIATSGKASAEFEAAAQWFVRSREGLGPEDSAEFEAWLAGPKDNRRAFERVSGAWGVLGEQGSTPELIALRRNALDTASKAVRRRWRRPFAGSRMMAAMVAACAVFALAASLFYDAGRAPTQTYSTGIGERRVVALADGSRVTLDGATTLSVRLSSRQRALTLVGGQAEFEVAKDRGRPFAVTARDHTVVATGTVFNVDVVASSLVVTLLEGHVLVARRGAAGRIEMAPGQELVVATGEPTRLRSNVDLTSALAWTTGKLVIDNQPLGEAIERVNRHAARKVRLTASAWDDVRFSGVFNAGDSDAFAAGVVSQLPLERRDAAEGPILLYPRSRR